MRFMRLLPAVVLAVAPVAFAGPDWDSDFKQDAGSTIQTAQKVNVNGPVQTIAGRLTGLAFTLGGDFQDVYEIAITDPGTFVIDLTGGGLNFDACLWLFDENGNPLLGTNDANELTTAPKLTNTSNAGARITLTTPGVYFFSVSGIGSEPTQFGKPLWPSIVFSPGIVAGSFGSKGPWDGSWSGDGAIGEYTMTLQGVSGVPAPGAIALVGLAGLAGRSSRRRRN
jgi:Bacterial pre-peptidase C-terminal domain